MKVLVANRGEIACRILRTLQEMGVASVAVYTDADRDSPHLDLASESVALGAPDQYLSGSAIVKAALGAGATSVHPGYGFLSQDPGFSRACEEAGLRFIGPTAAAMTLLGDKRASRRTAESLGIPVIPGAQEVDGVASAREAAARIGYPVLLKAAGGGGGKGMRRVGDAGELAEAHEGARREARRSFGDDRLLLERYVSPARHVEVQILGDGRDAIAIGERECSLQRRYQKVIEEAPAAVIPEQTRRAMADSAVRLARAAGYRNAGTVEFLLGPDGSYFFLEVNTRLQVEHPVTEMTTGLDLVRLQVELAHGACLPSAPVCRGHAIEARLNAEDPYRDFLPQAGRILMLEWPHRPGLRVDSGIREGLEVGVSYDPLLAKLIAWGVDREQARGRLIEALRETTLLGVATNQRFLIQVLESGEFRSGDIHTTTLESVNWHEPPIPPEVQAAARRALTFRAPASGIGQGDVHSPWHGFGRFRVGP